ncbi:MAG: GIY-YIG nuclease family protein [Dehalococcoidia bacterium]|nr:MAG: GIY-YIG nuclease family protein [Dehalococcoidia bacterium]
MESESQLLGKTPDSDGVYIIRSSQPFGRFRGESDTVYVGSSANAQGGLKRRIRFFFHPGPSQHTSKRIKALLDLGGKLQISFHTCTAQKARSLEKEILKEYVREHLELPPYNRSEPH